MTPEDTICYCFHVSLGKIETFCRREKPPVASQLSECLSAGTGCGWCVPMLRKVHARLCGRQLPWWRQELPSPRTDDSDADAYAAGRQAYLATKKKTHEESP